MVVGEGEIHHLEVLACCFKGMGPTYWSNLDLSVDNDRTVLDSVETEYCSLWQVDDL
jgi:hypothetical protein